MARTNKNKSILNLDHNQNFSKGN